MSIFHEILNKLPQFRQLEKTVAADGLPAMVIGLSSVHKAHFLYRLSESSDLPPVSYTHLMRNSPMSFFSPVAGSRVNATPVPEVSPMLPNAIIWTLTAVPQE